MNENRMKILQMLAQGQITADEAERLIAALEKDEDARGNGSESRPKAKPKYLRVMVKAADEGAGEGPVTVNVRVPMQLLRAGVKLASLIPVQARVHVNDALKEHGVPFDINQVKPENLEELVNELEDLTVDVDDKATQVRVFCE